MPPLSLTQLKYACAVVAPSVKSVPGCFVTIAPSLIGVPVAFVPGFVPHLVTSPAAGAALVAAPPVAAVVLLLLLLPHALMATARPTASTTASAADHVLPLFPIYAPPSLDQISSRRDQTRRVIRGAVGPGRRLIRLVRRFPRPRASTPGTTVTWRVRRRSSKWSWSDSRMASVTGGCRLRSGEARSYHRA